MPDAGLIRRRIRRSRLFERGWIWHEDNTFTRYVRVFGVTVRERPCADPFLDLVPGGLSGMRDGAA